jgi:hypothetical protein
LAKRTAQVTAVTSHRQDFAAGIIMVQGLFFYRIKCHGSYLTIIFTDYFTPFADSSSAKAHLPFLKLASVGTNSAFYLQ